MSNRDQNQKVLNQQKLHHHKSFGVSQSQVLFYWMNVFYYLLFTILFSYTLWFLLVNILSKYLFQYSKSTSRSSYQRPKLANSSIGNGMRAIFLESRHGSCGTGVFLPQRADTKFQPRKKPG
jgi:hypothetical protein